MGHVGVVLRVPAVALALLSAGPLGAQSADIALTGPTLEIRGDADARHLLVNIAQVIPLSDGRLAVLCWNDAVIRIFDARGRLLRSSGRKGEGPQEFSGMDAGGAYRGDSLWVVDRMWRRISIIDREGRLARRMTLAAPMARADANYSGDLSHVVGSLDDGSFVLRTPPRFPLTAAPGEQWYETELLVYSANAQRGPSLGHVRYSPVVVRRPGMNAEVAVPRFSVVTPLATYRSSVIVGAGDGGFVTRRTPRDGGRVSVDTLLAMPPTMPVLTRHTTVARQREREQALGFERPAATSAEVVAARFPSFVRIVPAGSGAVWLQGPERPGDSTTVSFLASPSGRVSQRVVTPSRFVAHAFDGTSVTGVFRDEDDVEHIRVYRLAPARPELR